ncbi:MAG: RtcB family protein [Anaerolineales bacterium]
MPNIREDPVPYRVWGDDIEDGARQQMHQAAQLPIAVRGALMPDAHQGYGLPIGGVLATREAVIPYAVGVDIACRMRLTVFDTPPHILEQKREKFRKIIEESTRFGIGAATELDNPPDHPVMDDPAFDELPVARGHKGTAWRQLGSSGGGNHFVEFGELLVNEAITGSADPTGEGSRAFGHVPPGRYLAFISHSGSRGLGATIADHYTKIAMDMHPDLPKSYKHLAWLDMNGIGAEYWAAMTLAGRYASANHAIIHQNIIDRLRLDVLGGVENHHNYAWREVFDDEEYIVHRKGSTPAGPGVYGVIPGSMTDAGHVVRGLGNAEALNSAAHGAGRRMSRGEAKRSLRWEQVEHKLKQARVELMSAGLDEAPHVYKDLTEVMAAQQDLVVSVAKFQPRLVKMAPDQRTRRSQRGKAKKKKRK